MEMTALLATVRADADAGRETNFGAATEKSASKTSWK